MDWGSNPASKCRKNMNENEYKQNEKVPKSNQSIKNFVLSNWFTPH